jgi:hypothetical protein
MLLEYGCIEDYLASKRAFSGRFLGLVNNPGYIGVYAEVKIFFWQFRHLRVRIVARLNF